MSCGSLRQIYLLAARGINARGKFGTTPLALAAASGHLEIVNALLQNGADPDLYGQRRVTPLMVAAENGHLEIVKALIAKGAKLDL